MEIAWKKVLLFGLFGAVGCLAGWLAGEPYLLANDYLARSVGAGQTATLISKPNLPSSEAPPLPADIRERVEKAGGKSGDVQISLIWDNVNDLDVLCTDPRGELIFFRNPRSRSGGELDVDANSGGRDVFGRQSVLTNKPVENIYWPKAGAPSGTYRVHINHFLHRPEAGAPNATNYKVNILHDGERREFEGTITSNGTSNNLKEIYTFELKPRIAVYAATEVEVPRGTTRKMEVAIQRFSHRGEVEVKLEKLPEGITAEKLTIPEDVDRGEVELKASDSVNETTSPITIKIVATGGTLSSSADVKLTVTRSASRFSLWMIVAIGLWTALLAVGLCFALVIGQNYYLGKPLLTSSRVSLVMVILGAAAAGFISGLVGQTLYSLLLMANASQLGFVGHMLGWILLGGLLGWGVSFFVPNLDALKAALAGLGGGFLGGLAFAVLSYAADVVGRFGGAALLGFCIGLMVAVVEAAFRRAWLEVRFSEREAITVNLGPEPVKVGSDAKACTVWARGAAAVALRYWIRDGKVYCEDVPTRREANVGDGDTRTAGNVTVVVRATGDMGAPRSASHPRLVPNEVVSASPALIPNEVASSSTPAAPAKASSSDWDDGLPMPMNPSPPARPKVTSILDSDSPAPTPKPVPPAAPVSKPVLPKMPAPPAAPTASSAKTARDPDACPSCGRKSPGKPGARYCMVCDQSF